MPNTDFVIDNTKLQRIADEFKIKKGSVETLFAHYMQLSEKMKHQYLAHIIRSMEAFFREETKNPVFVINCEPFKSHVKGQQDCSANYYPGRRFIIFYRSDKDDKSIRICIAHELGHLFLIAMNEIQRRDKRQDVYEGTTEPLSSIFGIFTISEKNDFYRNVNESGRNHENWDKILRDFSELNK